MVDVNLVNMNDDFAMMMETEISTNPAAQPSTPVAVGFGIYYQLDEPATAKAGHEVYRDVEFVKIVMPGDKLSLVFQPAADHEVGIEAEQGLENAERGEGDIPEQGHEGVSPGCALKVRGGYA
jgi:hypothetical protein